MCEYICPICGDRLDPGEKCECKQHPRPDGQAQSDKAERKPQFHTSGGRAYARI